MQAEEGLLFPDICLAEMNRTFMSTMDPAAEQIENQVERTLLNLSATVEVEPLKVEVSSGRGRVDAVEKSSERLLRKIQTRGEEHDRFQGEYDRLRKSIEIPLDMCRECV